MEQTRIYCDQCTGYACSHLSSRLRAAEERAEAAEHALAFNVLTVRAEVAERRAEGLEKALAGLVYCADCWDNPEHNVCEKHLAPARAALARPRSEETPTSPGYRCVLHDELTPCKGCIDTAPAATDKETPDE